MKRKLLLLTMSMVLALGLIGCSGKEEKADSKSEKAETKQEEAKEDDGFEEVTLPKAGVYSFDYEEELGGVNYTFTNYLIIDGNMGGQWAIQDTADITYDESTISTVYDNEVMNSYPYEIKGNSLFIDEGFGPNEYKLFSDEVPSDVAAWLSEQTASVAHNQCAEPAYEYIDPENPDDGEYWIWMKSFEECQDSYGMVCNLYHVEQYDSETIKSLQEGDVVYVDEDYMDIKTVETSGSLVIINGGEEEGGVSFRVYDDEPTCQIAGMDDFPSFQDFGEANLYVSPDCVITDSSDIIDHPEGIVMTPKEFKEKMDDPENYWYWNTSAVIKNNEVVEINIRFVP